MNLQEQRDIIQAAIDGRRITFRHKGTINAPYGLFNGHLFDFITRTYTIEPLYKEGEVIMVESAHFAGWEPRIFIEMDSEGALCYDMVRRLPVVYTNHRKQNTTDKGEA